MPLDPTAVGATGPSRSISWTSKDTLLYAVGIGAGRDDLAFSTENSTATAQRVYPTFAVVAGMEGTTLADTALAHIGDFDPARLVHGTQSVSLHQPIPPAGEATTQDRIVAMYDKGNAAVVVVRADAVTRSGEPLWTLESSAFIRGAGGWGGERGPSATTDEPPQPPADHERAITISADQAFTYRLSGDRNPLHTDPAYAARGGFERPILHGLCTFGFAGRVLLRVLCDDDVTRFEHIAGRFSAPVWPGDTITLRCWQLEPGRAAYSVAVADRTVISHGLVRYRGVSP